MTADEFILWAMERPETEHYELSGGQVIATAPRSAGHSRATTWMAMRLAEAVEHASLPCDVYIRGMAVQIGEDTVYEPDAIVREGPTLPGDAIKITDPLIVVEVLSAWPDAIDSQLKLIDYARLPSLRHYLIVTTGTRTVIHHQRSDGNSFLTRVIGESPLRLDPPGLTLDDLFPPEPAA